MAIRLTPKEFAEIANDSEDLTLIARAEVFAFGISASGKSKVSDKLAEYGIYPCGMSINLLKRNNKVFDFLKQVVANKSSPVVFLECSTPKEIHNRRGKTGRWTSACEVAHKISYNTGEAFRLYLPDIAEEIITARDLCKEIGCKSIIDTERVDIGNTDGMTEKERVEKVIEKIALDIKGCLADPKKPFAAKISRTGGFSPKYI